MLHFCIRTHPRNFTIFKIISKWRKEERPPNGYIFLQGGEGLLLPPPCGRPFTYL